MAKFNFSDDHNGNTSTNPGALKPRFKWFLNFIYVWICAPEVAYFGQSTYSNLVKKLPFRISLNNFVGKNNPIIYACAPIFKGIERGLCLSTLDFGAPMSTFG